MRTVSTTLYQFHELPPEAQRRAMDWWRRCENADPSWVEEHNDSRRAAVRAIIDLGEDPTPEEWARIRQQSKELAWTGYCADGILDDNASDDVPTTDEVRRWYARAWDDEMDDRMSDEYVKEEIMINEYEFHADGSIA